MRIFTVGPVEMYESTLKVRSQQLPYFRTTFFSDVMNENVRLLKKTLYTADSSKVAIITGSGSAAMEAVVTDSFDENDNLLVINGGSFGARFSKLCDIHQIPHDDLKLNYDEQLTRAHLESMRGNYSALLVNIHETSTGQLYDIHMLSEYCAQHQMKLVVDAISSFLCDELKMDEFGVDCVIISSQKALALAPGLSMVIMNDNFYQEKVKDKPIKNLYLNLNEHFKNLERGQTPNTPAVGVCYELLDMLKQVDQVGVEKIIQERARRATYFRSLIKPLSLTTPSFKLSNALTPIVFKDGGAIKVYDYLKDTYDIYVTPSGGDLRDKIIRVGHMGNMHDEYYDDLIKKIQEVS